MLIIDFRTVIATIKLYCAGLGKDNSGVKKKKNTEGQKKQHQGYMWSIKSDRSSALPKGKLSSHSTIEFEF